MKPLFLALALVTISAPAFANLLPEGTENLAQDSVCLRFGPFGGCIDDGHGRPLPPPPPGPGPGWGRPVPPPMPPRMIQCIAENYRGFRFEGYGRWPQEAQNNAIAACYNAGSRACQIRWCR